MLTDFDREVDVSKITKFLQALIKQVTTYRRSSKELDRRKGTLYKHVWPDFRESKQKRDNKKIHETFMQILETKVTEIQNCLGCKRPLRSLSAAVKPAL